MYAITKIRNPQYKLGVFFALIGVLAFHVTDALSSGPPEVMLPAVPAQSDAAPPAVPIGADPSSLQDAGEAPADPPAMAGTDPAAPELVDGGDRYPYVEGSQLNKPEDMTVARATAALVTQTPVVPEASTYAMLVAGLLGLAGMRKWKGGSARADG